MSTPVIELKGNFTRKLSAIMFTDMVGYTAVMQHDEMLAIVMQKRHQAVVEKHVKAQGGQVKNDMGDGSMSILPSAYAVIKCAMGIQKELQEDPKVNIRVGIHIADILEEESGKVHGDGINIASRIETLGVAGAILFSKEIYNKVKNQPEFKIIKIGSFPFKNVDESMEIYALANEGFSIPTEEQALAAGKLKKGTSGKPVKSKIHYVYAALVPLVAIILYFIIKPFYSSIQKPNPVSAPTIVIEKKYISWKGKVVYNDTNEPAAGIIVDINARARDTTDLKGEFVLELSEDFSGTPVKLTLIDGGKQKVNTEIRLTEEILKELKIKRE